MEWVNGQLVEKKYDGPTSAVGEAGGDMPEVKWAPELYDANPLTHHDCGIEIRLQPVLTLDQIAAWLIVTQLPKLGNKADYLIGYGDCIRNLLAQVQAWKEGK